MNEPTVVPAPLVSAAGPTNPQPADVTPATVDSDLVEVGAKAFCRWVVESDGAYAWDESFWTDPDDATARDDSRAAVTAVLAALAERGALLPAGGEHQEELGISFGTGWGIAPCGCNSACNARHTHRRTVTTWSEGHPLTGHTLIGPWREVEQHG